MFKGSVKSLDDHKQFWFEHHYGLSLTYGFVKKLVDDEGSLNVEIEIEDLKEEQTDYDEPMEAAAATVDDDKEKDSKNR